MFRSLRRFLRTARRSGLAAALLLPPLAASAAPPPRLWLAPYDNLARPAGWPVGPADFPDLFAPDATWPQALPQVKVFKIYGYFAGRAPEAEMRQLFAFLREHNIKLALEMGALTTPAGCGSESFNGQYLASTVQRIKSLGGTLDYFAMDEPLFYGHFYNGPGACHLTLGEMAANAAKNIAAAKAIMPGLQVGEVEIMGGGSNLKNWPADLTTWAGLFKQATGQPLAFVHFDVNWSLNWPALVAADAAALHRLGIPYGIILNGSGADKSDAAWAAEVRAHEAGLRQAGLTPDDVLFQTWQALPDHVLPASDPQSLTGLAHGFEDQESQ